MTDKVALNQDLVRQLAQILNDTDLTEIEYEMDGCRVRVARNLQAAAHYAVPSMPTMAAAPAPALAEMPSMPKDNAKHPGALKSPMVGNAYLAPAPEAAPFVKIGDRVTKGQTLLIIEAMKVMNQIKAHTDGILKEILVTSGEPVEFDQVLMVIES